MPAYIIAQIHKGVGYVRRRPAERGWYCASVTRRNIIVMPCWWTILTNLDDVPRAIVWSSNDWLCASAYSLFEGCWSLICRIKEESIVVIVTSISLPTLSPLNKKPRKPVTRLVPSHHKKAKESRRKETHEHMSHTTASSPLSHRYRSRLLSDFFGSRI